MAMTDAEVLEQLKEARDAVLLAIVDEAAIVEVEIRGSRVRQEPTKLLETIEQLIGRYQQKDTANRGANSRNLARINARGS